MKQKFIYDASVLIAADRNDRAIWADHEMMIENGISPIIPAPVLAQVSRSPRQAALRRLLGGSTVLPFTERDAHEAGHLLSRSRTTDIVDASVVITALRYDAVILTGDPTDIKRLVQASGRPAQIVSV